MGTIIADSGQKQQGLVDGGQLGSSAEDLWGGITTTVTIYMDTDYISVPYMDHVYGYHDCQKGGASREEKDGYHNLYQSPSLSLTHSLTVCFTLLLVLSPSLGSHTRPLIHSLNGPLCPPPSHSLT